MANDRIPDERFPNDPYMAGMSDVPPRSLARGNPARVIKKF